MSNETKQDNLGKTKFKYQKKRRKQGKEKHQKILSWRKGNYNQLAYTEYQTMKNSFDKRHTKKNVLISSLWVPGPT